MSEAMLTLTREQLTELQLAAKDQERMQIPGMIVDTDVVAALCTMALSSIAMSEALKPFADQAGKYEVYRDDTPIGVPVGDLRRAAEAYQEQGK